VIESKSEANLKAQLDANIADARTAASVQLQNANLTAGERYKIEADLQKKIQDLQRGYQVAILQQQKNISDANYALALDGSKKQLDAQLSSMKIQHDIDIVNAQDDATKKEKIDAEYFKNKTELLRKYSQQVAEDAANTAIDVTNDHLTNLQLQGFKDLDSRRY
jgi:hypothetical protein